MRRWSRCSDGLVSEDFTGSFAAQSFAKGVDIEELGLRDSDALPGKGAAPMALPEELTMPAWLRAYNKQVLAPYSSLCSTLRCSRFSVVHRMHFPPNMQALLVAAQCSGSTVDECTTLCLRRAPVCAAEGGECGCRGRGRG